MFRRAATTLGQRLGGSSAAWAQETGVLAADGAATTSHSFQQARNASNQAVKQRIRAIKNIGKITKAMKMVAASKMRNAQVAVEGSRGIIAPFVRLFGDTPAVEVARDVTLAVTSDRGLCGGLNSNIAKYTRALLAIYAKDRKDPAHAVAIIGDKGRSQLQRTDQERMSLTVADTYKQKVTFAQASMIAEEVLAAKPEAVRVIFNKFRSAISYKPTVATVLGAEALERALALPGGGHKLDAYELEVSHERSDLLRDLAEFNLAATLHNAMLENNCSEHASRMAAMENSTKSAGEMLSALTLAYNRKRQSTITTELIEIIAGASALMDNE